MLRFHTFGQVMLPARSSGFPERTEVHAKSRARRPHYGSKGGQITGKATPVTGRTISKARPIEEWRRVEVPELRIVSESIWDAVHARIRYVNEKLGIAL